MKLLFYPRLALSGIRKNSRLYTPYLLTCVGMVTVFVIFMYLNCSEAVKAIPGGGTLTMILSLGTVVIWLFALIFLAYTNSFLIRRRYREFGLYNVLGMGKGALTRLILWENFFVMLVSLTGGLLFGTILSKLAELGLCRIARGNTDYLFHFNIQVIRESIAWFVPIFLLLLAKSIFQVRRYDPLELLGSESYGEKPPKANYLLAIAGAALLTIAYYMAVTIDNPLSAILLFFVAVILVILATYLLFIAGSVTLCRTLQKNKRYYYKKNHFVSVSTMVYRMKRNGAGLASICILSTMVLVMLTATLNLYAGTEQILGLRNIRDNSLVIHAESIEALDDSRIAKMQSILDEELTKRKVRPENQLVYRYQTTSGMLTGGYADLSPDQGQTAELGNLGALYSMYFVSQADYNRASGENYHLEPGTALACNLYDSERPQTLNLDGQVELNIQGWIDWKLPIPDANVMAINTLLLVIPDYSELAPLWNRVNYLGSPLLWTRWVYAYDCDVPDSEAIALLDAQVKQVNTCPEFKMYDGGIAYARNCLAEDRREIYGFTGGMLFLGGVLSVVFLSSAALIIYYKQISEGYEDQARFAIMQKVGMTKTDIRKSINSQVLTVFFAPLTFAGLHLCFAYPLLEKMLRLFSFSDTRLMILVTIGVFGLFCCFYGVIYKATASAYYTIVSGGKQS